MQYFETKIFKRHSLSSHWLKTNGFYAQLYKGKRFANYLIDYLGTLIFGVLVFGLLIATEGIDLETENGLRDQLIFIGVYVAYYIFFEHFLGGKTLGKFITRTRVVSKDGQRPSFENIIGRSFSRVVPFEAFSFLGSKPSGWHDDWSNTIVIDERHSSLPRQTDEFV